MTKIVTTVENEGLESLLGQRIMIFCLNYIYDGMLTGINESCILLEDASIVYETGAFDKKGYINSQKLHTKKWYVQKGVIESFGLGK